MGQITLSIGVAIKSDKNDNNNNNNNNNNVNINDDNINFSSTGMQNMMSSGRSQFIRKQQIEFCARYFLCLIRERRYKLNDNEEIALKTLNLFMDYSLREILSNHIEELPSSKACIANTNDFKAICNGLKIVA